MRKIGLLICSLILSLFMVEAGLRLLDYDVNTHPFWTYHPGLGWVIKKDAHFDQVNASGFRHSPVGSVKPAGTRRLLVLGDSFTLATSFEYSHTFPGVLERLLTARGAWEVIALAVDDWGWAQQLIALEDVGLNYAPDVVVSQLFPLNDFCNNCLATANTCSMQDSQRPYFTLNGDDLLLSSLHPWRKVLRDRFKVAGLVENLLDDPWNRARRIAGDNSQDPDLSLFFEHNARINGLRYPDAIQSLLPPEHQQDELADCWQVSEKILARMKSITADHEIAYLAAVIPFLYTFEERWPELKELTSAPMEPSYATAKTEAILACLRVPTISMRAMIDDGEEPSERYFISLTDGHLSEFGHHQLAQWILEELENQELVKRQ